MALFAVRPDLAALAVHFSTLPVADEFVAIDPVPFTVPIGFALPEMTFVKGAICIRLTALSLHSVICPLTFIERTIRPRLLAVATLDPVDELSFVETAVAVLEFPEAVLDIVAEVAGVDGVICRHLTPEAIFLALLPPALEERAVWLRQRA